MESLAERTAVGLLQLLLDDMTTVLTDHERHPEARLLALVTARNIVAWNADTGKLKVTLATRNLVNNPLNI